MVRSSVRMTLGQALELAQVNQLHRPFVLNWAIQQKSQSGEIASHGRVPRPTHPEGCWLGKGDGFALPLHPSRTRGFAPRGPRAEALPLRHHQRAFALLGTMTGAFLPLRPRRGLSRPRPLVRAFLPRHLDGRPCLLRPPRTAARRSPREGPRALRRAGSTGARGGMSGAVKARQQPAARNARSLP
jgi:hypothetical protein